MNALAKEIPNVDLLLELQPEELGAKLLFVIKNEFDGKKVTRGLLTHDLWLPASRGVEYYPQACRHQVDQAIMEAWSWLEAQGLLIWSDEANGANGFRILSRRARQFEDKTEFAKHEVSRRLPKDMLHHRIADRVWSAFLRGEYDVAVFQAMKGVEVYVREVGEYGAGLLGTKLMQEAFKQDGGGLTDAAAEPGERIGRMQLFCGAIASYKNPNSHRDVDLNDPIEALEIIFLANHLMKIVDARAAEMAAGA